MLLSSSFLRTSIYCLTIAFILTLGAFTPAKAYAEDCTWVTQELGGGILEWGIYCPKSGRYIRMYIAEDENIA